MAEQANAANIKIDRARKNTKKTSREDRMRK